MAPAENMPDFDSMTPEEMMAWMETLAKRQGANLEELTTKADIEIPELDPDTVVIDEPGYVPYGEERPAKPAAPAAAAPKPAAPPPAPPPVPPPAAAPPAQPRQPAASAPPPVPPPAAAPPAQPQQPAASFTPPPPPSPAPAKPAAQQDAMAWLESLAADQGDALFNLDFSSLGAEATPAPAAPPPPPAAQPAAPPPAPTEQPPATDPAAWLGDLTRTGGEAAVPPPAAAEPETVLDPFASGVDPMAWLESLAKRQGAKSEELTTSANLNVPMPENAVVDEPGYKPFSFDMPEGGRRTAPPPPPPPPTPEPEPAPLEDPSAWLQSLTASGGDLDSTPEPEAPPAPAAPRADWLHSAQPEAPAEAEPEAAPEMSVRDIEAAVNEGRVSSEQMQYYLEHQMDRFMEQIGDNPTQLDEDEEAPLAPAELPDWLLETVGTPPAPPPAETLPPSPVPLIDQIVEPPTVADMPDWLKAPVGASNELDLDSIFANTQDEPAPPTPAPAPDTAVALNYEIEVDPNDPWVEAFDLEHEQGSANTEAVPDWYARNINDPARIAAVDRMVGSTGEALEDAPLPPERELPAGEPEPVPDWLQDMAPVAAAPAFDTPDEPLAAAEIPDWLREAQGEIEPEAIPDWLMDTLTDTQSVEAVAAAAPTPAPAPPTPAPQPPALVTAPYRPPSVAASLETARQQAASGDLDTSLVSYEALIRGSVELEAVISDMSQLARTHRNNPAVYRVLGDGLMRVGRLQEALNTYREALNQL